MQMENWHGGIPRHKSRGTMNMNTGNNILFQWELFHCHKYFTLWFNMTHLWALFRSSFCCSVHCSKTALMPFSLLYRHFLCATLAPCFVVFSSPPYWRDTSPQKKKHTHTYTNYVPVGTGVCPSSVRVEDEQCFYSKPSKSKIRILILTMTPLRIKEGHTRKTGSIITTQCTLGTVISPGALKEWTKHLKGAGKNVTEDRSTAVPEHIRGTSILLST